MNEYEAREKSNVACCRLVLYHIHMFVCVCVCEREREKEKTTSNREYC